MDEIIARRTMDLTMWLAGILTATALLAHEAMAEGYRHGLGGLGAVQAQRRPDAPQRK